MAKPSDIVSLVYVSEGSFPFTQSDLQELLAKANQTNSKLGITGMLLFKGGNFLQVLEGVQETVLTLYKKIIQDPRHERATVLFRGTAAQRDFPDWSMGFHDLSSPDTARVPGFTNFLDTSLTVTDFADARLAKRLLLLFKNEK